ncbi:WD repeat-containing 13 [Chlorella sorokiniana]|uniref:WD repeat-containing 13 n=1 Tax=Chlorella sorokiniana TaxID=3076 RepID=A0A2P6TPG9_CHLSO|nr:WD repeat-containing 13 [Chlorella sorokiniana]|eukprot:PRW55930.1 WD repeat-containing 13 [Chlorella sorokiniana]
MSLRSLMQLPPSHKQRGDVELGILPRPGSLEQPPTPPASAAATASSLRQPALPPSGSSSSLAPPCYEFRHRFAGGRAAISVVKFAPGSADVLAWGDTAGTVFLATAEEPPRLLQVLERHDAAVSDLDWSPDGNSLLSVGQDGIACLWRAADGTLVRALRNGSGPLCCCRFHPSNPNLLLLGTAAGELLALNASTGHIVARAELQSAPMSGVGACCLEAAGDGRFLVADNRGCLHLISALLLDGQLTALEQLAWFPAPRGRYHEPACLQYLPSCQLAGGPAVLLALSSGEVVLARLLEKPWRLEVLRERSMAPASAKIRAALRPGVARHLPELLLAGSEDCRVLLLDLTRPEQALQLGDALSAHSAPVLAAVIPPPTPTKPCAV